jgi:hypothetical protein
MRRRGFQVAHASAIGQRARLKIGEKSCDLK